MILADHITKTYPTPYGRRVVLDDITINFPARTNIGILGLNGAGKSTLLRLLGGAEAPDVGRVVHSGRVSWPLGFGGGFQGSLTGEEGCRFVARLYGEDEDDLVAYADEFAELGDYFFMPVKTYSTGMRSRLAFAVSMAIQFDVYLVDEGIGAGDRRFQNKCREAFEARAERSSVIIVSHSVHTIRQYCARCAVLSDGQLTEYDSVDEALAVYEGQA